jgi:hypothetical protein
MPRRISDYPDAFAGWNLISSFGSIISVVATWLFLHIVYLQLIEGKATSRYPWLTPQFYSDTLQTLLNRSYNSLEWALTSPPKPHAFVSLPLQSTWSPFNNCNVLLSSVFNKDYLEFNSKEMLLFNATLGFLTQYCDDIYWKLDKTKPHSGHYIGNDLKVYALKETIYTKSPHTGLSIMDGLDKHQDIYLNIYLNHLPNIFID